MFYMQHVIDENLIRTKTREFGAQSRPNTRKTSLRTYQQRLFELFLLNGTRYLRLRDKLNTLTHAR